MEREALLALAPEQLVGIIEQLTADNAELREGIEKIRKNRDSILREKCDLEGRPWRK